MKTIHVLPFFIFFALRCHRLVDREALALLLGTPRLQREICSFHGLDIFQVLMISAGWNSMNRTDHSTPPTAGSSLAGSARRTRCTLPHRPSFPMWHLTLPRFWGPSFWFGKSESEHGHSTFLHTPKLIQWQNNLPQASKLIQWQNNLPKPREVKTVQNCNKRALRRMWI